MMELYNINCTHDPQEPQISPKSYNVYQYAGDIVQTVNLKQVYTVKKV